MKNFKKVAIALLLMVMACSSFVFVGCKQEEELKIKQAFKTEYYVGDTLDVTNGILEYIDENGKSHYVSIKADMITGFSSETVGTRNMVITYEDLTTLVSYTISKIAVAEVNVIYWCPVTTGSEYNYYLLFINETTFISNQDIPGRVYNKSSVKQDLYNEYVNNPEHAITTTPTVQNGKTIYSFANGDYNFTLTAVDDNTIEMRNYENLLANVLTKMA